MRTDDPATRPARDARAQIDEQRRAARWAVIFAVAGAAVIAAAIALLVLVLLWWLGDYRR